jgi:copper(I)-binding protein
MRRWLLALALLCPMDAARAEPTHVGTLVIDDVSASATLGRSTTAAAYVTVRNDGTEPDRLLAASSPLAERTALHLSLMEGGVMRMRPVDVMDIPPGETVAMAPGGALHLMLEGLRQPLREGETVPIGLRFERAGEVEVQARIVRPGGHGH